MDCWTPCLAGAEKTKPQQLWDRGEGLQCPLLTELGLKPLQGEMLSRVQVILTEQVLKGEFGLRGNTLGAVTEVPLRRSPLYPQVWHLQIMIADQNYFKSRKVPKSKTCVAVSQQLSA